MHGQESLAEGGAEPRYQAEIVEYLRKGDGGDDRKDGRGRFGLPRGANKFLCLFHFKNLLQKSPYFLFKLLCNRL